MSNKKETLEEKLHRVSATIQVQLQTAKRAIKELQPIAQHLGYIVDEKTGEIAKIANNAN